MNNSWIASHYSAMIDPDGFEIVDLIIRGWADYEDVYRARYESRLADDYVLGDAWIKIGRGLLALLDGELGRLDGGILDSYIRDSMRHAGFNPDTYETIPDLDSEDESDA